MFSSKHKRKLFVRIRRYLLFTGIMLITLIILFEKQMVPFEQKCVLKQARAVSNDIINKSVRKTLDKLEYSYDDLAKIDRDESGEVKSIISNSININKLKSNVALSIQKQLDKDKMYYFTIPLGVFTHINYLNDEGPDVTLNFKLIGSVKCKLKNKFESAGLNQTVHHIYLVITTNLNVLSTEFTKEMVYKSDYEIAQTVIVGGTPSTYANILR